MDARRPRAENPNSSVVAETMKLLANSSYGFHIMDGSRYTVTFYLNDEKTDASTNSKLFKKVNHIKMQYMKLNSRRQRLNTKNQSLSSFLSFKTQNAECW